MLHWCIMPKSGADSEVILVSLYPGGMTVTGLSGRIYDFPHSGSEVKVLDSDAIEFLKKKRRVCCGGSPSPFFQLGGSTWH